MNQSRTLSAWLTSLLLLGGSLHAAPVDSTSGLLVAENFFRQAAANLIKTDTSLSAINVDSLKIATVSVFKGTRGENSFYTIQFSPEGWVIISAENMTTPVLGYSLTGFAIEPDGSLETSFNELLSYYSSQIDSVRANPIENTLVEDVWDALIFSNVPDSMVGETLQVVNSPYQPVYATTIVPSLIQSTWNQGIPWNKYAPARSGGPGGKAYSGCVAVSTSQVMKYYEHPAVGAGTRNSIDFSASAYDYEAMPLYEASDATALLLKDVGYSVDMNWGASGSGAYSANIPVALKTYFGYNSAASYVHASAYTSANWIALLKSEIDAGRPVIYEGFGNGSGHSFIVDGYNSSNYFHMNFGWSGYLDGWFLVTDITPGTMNFTSSQGAIIGVRPDEYKHASGQVLAGGTPLGEVFVTGDLMTWTAFSDVPTWTKTTGTMSNVKTGDLDGDGKFDEAWGIGRNGALWKLTDGVTWVQSRLYAKIPVPADLDGDGKVDEIAIINNKGKVAFSLDQTTWDSIPGIVAQYLMTIDMDGDGKKDDVLAFNASTKRIYISTDLETWTDTMIAPYAQVAVADLDGDGVEDDLIVSTSTQIVSTSTDLATWVIGKGKIKEFYPADFDGDGINESIYGRNSVGAMFEMVDTGWVTLPSAILATVTVGDFNGDGMKDDLAGATSRGATYVRMRDGDWYHLNGVYKNLEAIDLDGDGKLDDLMGTNATLYPYYTTQVNQVWMGAMTSLTSIDKNGNGTVTDLLAIDALGSLFFSAGNKEWEFVPTPEPVYKVIAADLSGSGKASGVVMIGKTKKKVYYSADLDSWTEIKGTYLAEWVTMGDLDGDGYRNELIINATDKKSIWTSMALDTMVKAEGAMMKVQALDLDGDGKEDDMIGITSGLVLSKKVGAGAWESFATPNLYRKDIMAYDADGDGVNDDIASIGKDSKIYTRTDGTTWKTRGKLVTQLQIGDFDGDDVADDLAALGTDKKLYAIKDGSDSTWSFLSSTYKIFAVGDFALHVDDVGDLKDAVEVASSVLPGARLDRNASASLQRSGSRKVSVDIRSTGEIEVWWVDSKGQQNRLLKGDFNQGSVQQVSLPAKAQGAGWVLAKTSKGIQAKLPVVLP